MNVGTGVFVLQNESTLVAMQAASFASEDDFQRLLASFPELLAGDQIDAEVPRRFMLVAREQGIASEEGAGGRWSIDHLFLDQDGVPTLVEVKRGADTRIRREVVGQMLDYAANAVLHWPVDALRARFAERCASEGNEPASVLSRLIGVESDGDAFWEQVRTNLAAGRIRLLFVADRIPSELRRIVEFLNRQMRPAEVLAIELRQYEGQGLKTLVPIVLGQTQDAVQKKGGAARVAQAKRQWDRASLLADMAEKNAPEIVAVANSLIAWIDRNATRIEFNDNPRWASMMPQFDIAGSLVPGPFRLWSDGMINLTFQYMLDRPVFGDAHRREEMRRRLNLIPGVTLREDAITKRPTVQLAILAAAGALNAFLAVMDWFVAELKQTGQASAPTMDDVPIA